MSKLLTTVFEVESNKIPNSFDGFNIVQITDLHNAVFGEKNMELLNKLELLNPDVVFLTGDLIIGEGECYKSNIELLRIISEKYDTYSVLGNHEQEAMIGEHSDYYSEYFEIIEGLKIKHLNNENIKLYKNEDCINLYGMVIPLEYYPEGLNCFKRRKEKIEERFLCDVVGDANSNEFNIMLAHNPLYFEDYAKYDIDLIFSGHVHGGMIRIPGLGGLLSPERRFFPKYDWGKYERNGSTLIVGKGLGGGGWIPRILCSPEIICVRLKKIVK